MYDLVGKLMNGIKSRHVNILACVTANGGESECFRIDSGVRPGCIMLPWLFNVYMDVVMKEMKVGMEGMGMRFLGEGRLPGLLYVRVDDLVLCGEFEDLRSKACHFNI